MRNKYYSESSMPGWLKWGFIVCCLIIVSCLVYSIFLYKDIQSSKEEGFFETEQQVLKNTDIVVINDIIRFHGDKAYHVVMGATDKDQEKIIFVPLSEKDKDYTVIDIKDILSRQSIMQSWANQCNNCELIKIIPALIKNNALWEITYKDNAGRHVLEYYSIYDGSLYEQFRFKRMFK